MRRRWKANIRRLRHLGLVIGHRSEQAEAKVEDANIALRNLRRSKAIADIVVLGPILFARSYPPNPGRTDTGEIVQAVLWATEGIGAAFWDSELYADLAQVPDGRESEIASAFVPFQRCEPVVRAALLPHIHNLMEELTRRLPDLFQHDRGKG